LKNNTLILYLKNIQQIVIEVSKITVNELVALQSLPKHDGTTARRVHAIIKPQDTIQGPQPNEYTIMQFAAVRRTALASPGGS
jgi:hypothetical protein